MSQPNLKQIMSKIRSFPSMPATGAKMLKMLEDPETSVDEIEDVYKLALLRLADLKLAPRISAKPMLAWFSSAFGSSLYLRSAYFKSA